MIQESISTMCLSSTFKNGREITMKRSRKVIHHILQADTKLQSYQKMQKKHLIKFNTQLWWFKTLTAIRRKSTKQKASGIIVNECYTPHHVKAGPLCSQQIHSKTPQWIPDNAKPYKYCVLVPNPVLHSMFFPIHTCIGKFNAFSSVLSTYHTLWPELLQYQGQIDFFLQ